MIKKEQLIPLILEACPSFKERFDKCCDKDLLYVVAGELAAHLLYLYREEKTEEFTPVCHVFERLHIEGDNYVKELATVGFLEGIQNIWGNKNVDPEEFSKFLEPESKKWWKELNDFWNVSDRGQASAIDKR